MKYLGMALLAITLLSGCEEINKQLEKERAHNRLPIEDQMSCKLNSNGICVCTLRDSDIHGGLAIGLAIDPTKEACDE